MKNLTMNLVVLVDNIKTKYKDYINNPISVYKF